jgi:dihydrofolate reductase
MIFAEISMSLDGYVAGPNDGPANGLGDGGEQLHEWMFQTAAWREQHGRPGGDVDVDSEIVAQVFSRTGAVVMGGRMFAFGQGPWGEDPPFRMPVLVLSRTPRAPLVRGETTFAFVTDGIGAAVSAASEAAGDSDVLIAGGGSAISQALDARVVDELRIHLVPLLLGAGVRLFNTASGKLRVTKVVASPAVTHLWFSAARSPA